MAYQSFLTWRLLTRARLYTVKPLFQVPFFHTRFFTQTHHLHRPRGKKPPFIPSHEQQKVVKLCSTQNVIVSARPGSGKTATAEAIVAAYPDKRVAVLTYSKKLQLETSRRLHPYPNCDVFTFHGMASSLFRVVVLNNAVLLKQRKKVGRSNELPRWTSEPYDIIVLDEFQDCTELIFWLVNCFIQANERKKGGQSVRLVVLGDERQSIHRFLGADPRYLTLAPELLGPISRYPFAWAPLSQSFRLSHQTVQFISRVFLGGEQYITSSKPGPKPIVLRCYPHKSYSLAKKLMPLIRQYGPENTAIIAPSIRKKGPLQNLVNILSEKYRVPIAVPIDDESPLDGKVIDGKMCISNIHQFKGSERDLIILFGMDSSFFKYFGRSLPDDRCPNEVFVALTRAVKQLVLVHNESEKPMPFVSMETMYKTAEIVNIASGEAEIALPDAPGRPLQLAFTLPSSSGVRDMTRHLQDESLAEIVDRELDIQKLSLPLPDKDHIDIPNVVLSDPKRGFYETVSDINGLVVTAAFELDATGTLNTLGSDQTNIDSFPSACPQQQISWFCRHACDYQASISGYRPRVIQMENHKFNWIKPRALVLARSRLQGELEHLTENLRFEVEVDQEFRIGDQKTRVRGRADIATVSSTTDCNNSRNVGCVWEIKFVSQRSNEHIIQACTYAYLLAPLSGDLPRIILYNVRDGEKLEITARGGREGLLRMIENVLRLKYSTAGEMKDEDFFRMCTKASLEVSTLHG
ncbi:hypothetical protein AK830_g202 [Neonectria ditissima]|uniref:Uncharacterized protein n=1 Tax=Neonectria ditissima TaxID=78410 RepID=A0A0P7BMB4_9HYPO|nr:hypothetical protein AK830_g202 [Neonectria ditissima]